MFSVMDMYSSVMRPPAMVTMSLSEYLDMQKKYVRDENETIQRDSEAKKKLTAANDRCRFTGAAMWALILTYLREHGFEVENDGTSIASDSFVPGPTIIRRKGCVRLFGPKKQPKPRELRLQFYFPHIAEGKLGFRVYTDDADLYEDVDRPKAREAVPTADFLPLLRETLLHYLQKPFGNPKAKKKG